MDLQGALELPSLERTFPRVPLQQLLPCSRDPGHPPSCTYPWTPPHRPRTSRTPAASQRTGLEHWRAQGDRGLGNKRRKNTLCHPCLNRVSNSNPEGDPLRLFRPNHHAARSQESRQLRHRNRLLSGLFPMTRRSKNNRRKMALRRFTCSTILLWDCTRIKILRILTIPKSVTPAKIRKSVGWSGFSIPPDQHGRVV